MRLVRFPILGVCKITKHHCFGRQIVLVATPFDSFLLRSLGQRLTQFLAHLGVVGYHLHVKPKEMTHLVER